MRSPNSSHAQDPQRWAQALDPEWNLLKLPASSVGYHTNFSGGEPVHELRASAAYAASLLCTGREPDSATAVLAAVLQRQETDPTSLHFGLWSWYAEEPLEKMCPADWNWADFVGAQLAEIAHGGMSPLTPEMRAAVENGLARAAWSIFRRNIGSGYTNICVMGAGVTLAAGEMLGYPLLVEYGVKRLANLRRHVEHHGGYAEYNSPNYTLVALAELERILHLCRHDGALLEAELLRRKTWELIAAQYHPGTGQWAGAQSRNYRDWLSAGQIAFFKMRGVFLPSTPHAGDAFIEPDALVHPLPCPADLRGRFECLPRSPLETRQRWTRTETGGVDTTTWFADDATLGSVNAETAWTQRRVLLGFWRAQSDPAVRLRLRVLHNGRDFASAFVQSDQKGAAVLSVVRFVNDQGEYHPHFGKSDAFRSIDLRVRYEIEGNGVQVRKTATAIYELACTPWSACIQPGPASFDGQPVQRWESGAEGDKAWVDAVLHCGSDRELNAGALGPSFLSAALDLLPDGNPHHPDPIAEEVQDGCRKFMWRELCVIQPHLSGGNA